MDITECERSLYFSTACMRQALITGANQTDFDAQNMAGGLKPYRSTGTTAIITAEYPTEKPANTLVLSPTNLTFDAEITLLADGVDVGPLDIARAGPEPFECFDEDDTVPNFPSVLIANNNLTGDGATTSFTVGGAAGLDVSEMQVFMDGLRQKATTDYSITDAGFDAIVTFTTAPPNGASLFFYAATELRAGVGVEADDVFAGDGVTTTFAIAGGAGIGSNEAEVYIDGLRQEPTTDFTINAGGSVIFTTAPPVGAFIEVYVDYDSTQARGAGVRVSHTGVVGDGSTLNFSIPTASGVTTNALEVFRDGFRQIPNLDYSVVSLGTTLSVTFSNAPPLGAVLFFFADSSIPAAIGYGEISEEWPRRPVFVQFPKVDAQVWTLRINDPGNRDGYIEAGRMIIDIERSAEHISAGWSMTAVPIRGRPRLTVTGKRIPLGGPVRRTLSLRTTLMTPEKAYEKMRTDLALGLEQELFVVICPEDRAKTESTSFIGTPSSIPAVTDRAAFGLFSRPLVLEEVLF